VIEFDRHGILLPARPENRGGLSLNERRTSALFGDDDPKTIAELQWRLSMPLSVLLLSLLAVPLAHTSPRAGRYSRIAVAILIYIPYANLLVLARKWVAAGSVPAWLGLWWVHVLVLLLAFLLIAQRQGWRWTGQQLRGKAAT
jgi:lipopolysaccharide export system permease protein